MQMLLESQQKITLLGENYGCYLTSLPEFSVTHYLPICPLWTGLIIDYEIRKLALSKEKRISPDGNCLSSSISYVITGTDYYHTENQYRKVCTDYCSAQTCFLNIIVLQLKTTIHSVCWVVLGPGELIWN